MSLPTPDELTTRLQTHGNVLLTGPPGTGKTDLMRRAQRQLEVTETSDRTVDKQFNPESVQNPFRTGAPQDGGTSFPGEVRTAWLTFHESMSHSEFMLGLRPRSTHGGTTLEPRAGILLELAEHARGGNTSVLFIDELNRANVSKVFGQFITAMEPEKRLAEDGTIRDTTVGLTLPQVDTGEEIQLPGGGSFEAETPYYFPPNLYIVASMNALDRSTAPLDSALARRFEQLQIDPDYEAFVAHLQPDGDRNPSLDPDHPIEALSNNPSTIAPEVLAVGLLKQVNTFLRGALGDDFQLGPGYLWSVGDAASDPTTRIQTLANAWDTRIVPKLQELFRSRSDQLDVLLRPSGIETISAYPYEQTDLPQRWTQRGLSEPLNIGTLADCNEATIRQTLHAIATQSVA